MDEGQKIAAEQLANIEIIKFMLLDLWNQYLHEHGDTANQALYHRDRQIRHLQFAVDKMPASTIRHALLGQAEENWHQIFKRLEIEGVPMKAALRSSTYEKF